MVYFDFIHLKLKRLIRLYQAPGLYAIPISKSGQNLYPFSDQNGSKTIPFGAVQKKRTAKAANSESNEYGNFKRQNTRT